MHRAHALKENTVPNLNQAYTILKKNLIIKILYTSQ